MRGCRWRVRKLPNTRISILSPERRERTMLSKIASTMTSDSFRVISTTRETSSIRSALVIAFSSRVAFLGMKPQYRGNLKDLQASRMSSKHAVHLFVPAVLQAHVLFNRGSGGSGLAVVILQAVLLFVLGNGTKAETDLVFGLAHLDDLEIVLLTHVYWRLLATPPARIPRHFRE